YAFYRLPEFAKRGGPEMVRFLDSVADILRAKQLYFGTSHLRLSLSRVWTGSGCLEWPSIIVYADGKYVHLAYYEAWDEGDLRRPREGPLRCPAAGARAALLELLARLKPADA